jgi:diacylglycerol kinase (ATP)
MTVRTLTNFHHKIDCVEKEKLLFVINPISGAKNKVRIPDLIKKHLDAEQFIFDIEFTQRAGHAEELTRSAVENGYQKVIAVGGDGTINEIARVLIHQNCSLGILPSGSGNGLSRHLGLPLNPVDAIKVLNKNKSIVIDSGNINGHPFLCTSGIGFDAHIGRLFAESKVRGFNTYLRTTISEFLNYSSERYFIEADGNQMEVNAFLITFANSAQYGNNAYISPHADIQDGLIDLCILSTFPKYMIVPLGISLFKKTADQSRFLKIIKTKEVKVERLCEGPIHVDGEPVQTGKKLTMKVVPSSLTVIVP